MRGLRHILTGCLLAVVLSLIIWSAIIWTTLTLIHNLIQGWRW